jgi:hypothetical protein
MKQIILGNWTFFRFFRFGIGIAVIIQAFLLNDLFFGLAGLLVAGMALLNKGCCGAGGCNTIIEKKDSQTKDISYEEVV